MGFRVSTRESSSDEGIAGIATHYKATRYLIKFYNIKVLSYNTKPSFLNYL